MKNPDIQYFLNTFDDSKTEETNALISDMQIAALSALAVHDHLETTIKNAKSTVNQTPENTSTVYRAQGGVFPNASLERVVINPNGKIQIDGDEMLHVTLDDSKHSVYFYEKRGGSQNGASIVSFEIPQSLAEEIKNNAVPQSQGKAFPDRPQIDDPTKSKSAFGLPKKYIEKLRDQAIKGSGKVQQ
ncbi:MAG TPA: hypothetical protein VIH86_07645 [Puia sp.]